MSHANLDTVSSPPDKAPDSRVQLFTAPLTTLIQSLEQSNEIHTHDLIEAYHVLHARIRSKLHDVTLQTQIENPFREIAQHAKSVALALRRDISRAIPDETLDEDIQRNFASLSNIAARVLADLFSIPILCEQLSDLALSKLMASVISVLRAPNSARSVKAFLFWILQRQRLPANALISHRSSICEVLADSIRNEDDTSFIIIALKAIHNLFRLHPVEFFVIYKTLLEPILNLLVSKESDVRFHAIHALSSIALAKTETVHIAENEFYDLAVIMKDFMDTQGQHKPPPGQDMTFENVLLLDLKDAARVPWVMTTLACFVVLTDSYLFSHPRTIRFIRNVLQACRLGPTRAEPSLQTIHAGVLKCLVWAFGRIPSGCRGQSLPVEGADDLKERAFLFINNDTLLGVPTAIVIALQTEMRGHTLDGIVDLGFSPAHHLIENIFNLVQKPSKSRIFKEAARLLLKLIRAADQDHPDGAMIRADILIQRQLLDNTVLFATKETIGDVVCAMSNTNISAIRPLAEEDIADNWDKLFSSWSLVANAASRTEFNFQDELIHSWRTLLSIRVTLSQRNRGIHATSVVEQRIGDVLANFVTAKGPSLRLLLGLWKTMAEICESSWWHHPANAILQAPRKHPMNLDSEKLEAWSSVVELLHTYSTDVQHLRDLVMSECMLTARIRGMVWNHVGSKLVDSPPPRWASEDLLFCLVPVGNWSMDDSERVLCGNLLDLAIPNANIEEFFRSDHWERLSARPLDSYVLLSRLPINTVTRKSMLPTVASILERASTFELYLALDYVQLFQKLLVDGSSSDIETLQTVCCHWISNEEKRVSPPDYNAKVFPLYETCLSVLENESTPGIATLEKFGDLITSAFHYSPLPALGPMAFERFWIRHYRDRPNIAEECPLDIKEYLHAFDHAYQGNLTAGFPESLDSQLTGNGTIIPDSQPPFTPTALPSKHHALFQSVSPSSRAISPSSRQFPPSPLVGRCTSHLMPSNALERLQDYASQIEDTSPLTSEDGSQPTIKHTSLPESQRAAAATRKDGRKMIFDGVVITTTRSSGSSRRAQESQLWTPGPSLGDGSVSDSGHGSPSKIDEKDDYDAWEQGISADDAVVLGDLPMPPVSALRLDVRDDDFSDSSLSGLIK